MDRAATSGRPYKNGDRFHPNPRLRPEHSDRLRGGLGLEEGRARGVSAEPDESADTGRLRVPQHRAGDRCLIAPLCSTSTHWFVRFGLGLHAAASRTVQSAERRVVDGPRMAPNPSRRARDAFRRVFDAPRTARSPWRRVQAGERTALNVLRTVRGASRMVFSPSRTVRCPSRMERKASRTIPKALRTLRNAL